jgi:hypothetical protein
MAAPPVINLPGPASSNNLHMLAPLSPGFPSHAPSALSEMKIFSGTANEEVNDSRAHCAPLRSR